MDDRQRRLFHRPGPEWASRLLRTKAKTPAGAGLAGVSTHAYRTGAGGGGWGAPGIRGVEP
jgi:hypothetical protein